MTLTLPTAPNAASALPRLITAGRDLAPAFGGPVNRVNRLGARWAFDVELDAMRYATAMDWNDLENEVDMVLWPVPQPGVDVGTEGTPVADGGSQSGNALLVRGCSASYAVERGRWLSVITSGARYLYQCRADAAADGAGDISIPVRPLLRISPDDGDTVELAAPKIEGFISRGGGLRPVTIRTGLVHGVSFTIEERR